MSVRRFAVLGPLLSFVLVGLACSSPISNSSTTDEPVAVADTFNVPIVVGELQRSATNTLLNAGFAVEEQFARDPSGEFEAGQVFDQQPKAGTELESGSIVTIFITEAEATVSMPAGDAPAGEGDPGGEPIEPTTTLGSDAIWPEPLDPAGPEAVAQRFASEVLGWETPQLTVRPVAAPDGPTWVTIGGDTPFDVTLQAFPFGDRGWGVIQIGDATSIGVAERPEGWTRVEIQNIPEVARVVVHIAELSGKTRAWEADLTDYVEPSSMVVPDLDIADIATILILYEDQTGRTLTANGSQYGVG